MKINFRQPQYLYSRLVLLFLALVLSAFPNLKAGECDGVQYLRRVMHTMSEPDWSDGAVIHYSMEYQFNPQSNLPNHSEKYAVQRSGNRSLLTCSEFEFYTDESVRIRTIQNSRSILVSDNPDEPDQIGLQLGLAQFAIDSLLAYADVELCESTGAKDELWTIVLAPRSDIPAKLAKSVFNFRTATYVVNTQLNQLLSMEVEFNSSARHKSLKYLFERIDYDQDVDAELDQYVDAMLDGDRVKSRNDGWRVKDVRLRR